MSEAVNLPAGMENPAEPRIILITEEIHKLIAPLFETGALGPMQVKGKAESVPFYRLLATKEVPAKVLGIEGLESPLVGRQMEFGAL